MSFCDFKPPTPNSGIIKVCRWLCPLYLKRVARLSINFTANSLERLFQLKDQRVVMFLNHPHRLDPFVIAALDQELREQIHCVVAREVFDWNRGLRGWLFQRLGCYSVDRGNMDIKSVRMTSRILGAPRAKLVVFPEGRITCDNMLIHGLQKAFIHILLDVQTEMRMRNETQSLWILPVATQYHLDTDLTVSLSPVLGRVERRLNIKPSGSITSRVDNALEILIDRLEGSYGIAGRPDSSLRDRIEDLSGHICKRIGQFIGLNLESFDEEGSDLYRTRHFLARKLDDCSQTAFNRSFYKGRERVYRQFMLDLDRVERLVICHTNLQQEDSPIKYCRTLDFLEYELFGKMSPKGRTKAIVNLGSPIEVSTYLKLYKVSKAEAVQKLTGDVRQSLQFALDELSRADTDSVTACSNPDKLNGRLESDCRSVQRN